MSTKKELGEALYMAKLLVEAATRKLADAEALAEARLREVTKLQDDVLELQIKLGEELDRNEKYRYVSELAVRDALEAQRELAVTPAQRLRRTAEKFVGALLRRKG